MELRLERGSSSERLGLVWHVQAYAAQQGPWELEGGWGLGVSAPPQKGLIGQHFFPGCIWGSGKKGGGWRFSFWFHFKPA